MQPVKATEFRIDLASDQTIWRSFLAIAELGSLTRAAVYLDSNQSLLSRQINALERQCGCRLFTRTGRGVELSETGSRILGQVRDLLLSAQQLEMDIRSNLQQPAGRVTLGLLPSISAALVGRLFSYMREHFPAVQLKILEGSSGQVEEWMADARVDLAILYRYATLPENEQKLATVDSYLVGPRGDFLTSGEDIPVSALSGLPFILPSAPNGLRNALDAVARQDRLTVNPVIEADSLPLFKSLVEEERLYSVLPLHAVWSEIKDGRLQAAKVADLRLQRSITMAMSKSKGPTRAVQVASAAVRSIVQELGERGMWHSTALDVPVA